MDVTQLNKPEIVYELRLRRAHINPTHLVDQLRTQLSLILEDTESHPPSNSSPCELNVNIQDITKILTILPTYFATIPIRKAKITTYLNHLRNRLNLIEITSENSTEEVEKITTFWNQLSALETRLAALDYTPPVSTYHSAENVQNSSPSHPILDTLAQRLANLSDNRSSNEIKRFNYKGDGCPKDFLQHVEEFATSRNISNTALYNHIYDILSGPALDWFRSKKDTLQDWSTFKTAFTKDFEIVDYDYKLMKTIDARKQKSNERIIIYFSSMESLFSKLHEPIQEKDKINIIRRNLQPEYGQRLSPQDLHSITSLLESCKWIESCMQVSTSDSSSPSHTTSNRTTYSPSIPPFPYNSPQSIPIHSTTSPYSFTCPRCRTNDHHLSTCTNPQKVCFRCGRQDVTFPNCPVCRKSHPKNV